VSAHLPREPPGGQRIGGRCSSSAELPDGVVRNLPARAARAALDPVVALAQAGLDLQEELEFDGIGLGDVFALPQGGGWSSDRAVRF
jgi:hypothetical protein